MILTDREIRLWLAEGLIRLEPPPPPEAYGPSSVDLTLGPELREFRDGREFDPGAPGWRYEAAIEGATFASQIGEAGYRLAPQGLILAWTRERVALTAAARVAARVEGRSSLARLGLAVHVTAPTIQAGSDAPIQLEIVNHGPLPIRLRAGMAICQLIFEQTLGTPENTYRGQFHGQAP